MSLVRIKIAISLFPWTYHSPLHLISGTGINLFLYKLVCWNNCLSAALSATFDCVSTNIPSYLCFLTVRCLYSDLPVHTSIFFHGVEDSTQFVGRTSTPSWEFKCIVVYFSHWNQRERERWINVGQPVCVYTEACESVCRGAVVGVTKQCSQAADGVSSKHCRKRLAPW